MSNKQDKKIEEMMALFGMTFEREITEPLIAIYDEALAPYSKHQIDAAAKKLILTSKFFPRPADFIEILSPQADKVVARRNDDAIAAAAWDTFIRWLEGREKLEDSDPVLRAGEAIGGKGRFSSMPYDQIEYYRGDFKDAYLTILNEQERGEALKEIGAPEKECFQLTPAMVKVAKMLTE